MKGKVTHHIVLNLHSMPIPALIACLEYAAVKGFTHAHIGGIHREDGDFNCINLTNYVPEYLENQGG